MSVELVIGGEHIPGDKTYLFGSSGIQLPRETVLELVHKYELTEVQEISRGDGDYPWEYRVPFNGTEIYFISSELVHFD